MPIYEYQCARCDRRTEVIQRISDPPLATCDECGGDLTKLISAPAFQFKGSGWYVTDYARKGGGEGDAAKKDAAGDKTGDKPADSAKSTGDSAQSAGDSGSAPSAKKTGLTKPERMTAQSHGRDST